MFKSQVVTASKKLHAASAGGNVMPAKKVELSDGSSSDNGSNKDDVSFVLDFCLIYFL